MRQLSFHVEMKNSKSERKRLSRTLRTLYYWGKCIGIVTFALSKNNALKRSYRSIIYCLILTALHCAVMRVIIIKRFTSKIPGETPLSTIIDMLGMTLVSVELFAIWFFFAFRYNRLRKFIRCLIKVEQISAKLNITDDYEKHFVQLRIQLTIVTILVIAWAYLINEVIFDMEADWTDYIWSALCLFSIPSYNATTVFLWIVIVVRKKFRRLNEKVGELIDENRERSTELENRGTLEFSRARFDWTLLPQQIDNISQLHRGLRDVVQCIEEVFGLIIFCNIMKHLSQIALTAHVVYIYIEEVSSFGVHEFLYAISIMSFNIAAVTVILLVSNVCGSATDEANCTGNMVHVMLNKHDLVREDRVTAKFNVLFLDLLHNRVNLTLFGFLELRYYLIYGCLVTSNMYLMIMLQFYG